MLSTDVVESLARELQAARKERRQVRHFSQRYPSMTIEDGYAVQRVWVKLEQESGRTIRGRKIGLTSRAMQLSSQIVEPDFAPLMDDMFFEAGGDIPIHRFIAPRVEVELAFVLGKRLSGPDCTIFDVYDAVEHEPLFAMHRTEPNLDCPVGHGIRPVLGQVYGGIDQALRSELMRTSIADVLRSTLGVR